MSLTRYDENQQGRALARRPNVHVTERDISLIERQAAILAKSSLVPLTNPADIAMIGLRALALGVDPMAAFDDLFPIDSGGAKRITISARMRVALARRVGCKVEYTESTDTRATCRLQRPGERTWHTLTYTIEQARTAKLATKNNWSLHPAAMLRAAAARQLVNMAAQDVLLGIQGMHEIDLDADVDDLDLPEETIDHSAPDEIEEAVVMATEEDRDDLLAAIGALGTEQQEWLKDRMKAAGLPPVRLLQSGQVAGLRALIEMAAEVGERTAGDGDGDADTGSYESTDEMPF
jgi:hypothetical protein